ncbi:MAG: alpha/beta fold hydrolase [Dehalococcoidia bacterium]
MDAPPIRYTTTSDGVDIAYAVIGSEHTGPPVVMVNVLVDAGIDAQLASEMEMQTYAGLLEARRVVVFDWRGVGVSAASPDGHSRDGLLRDLAAVVDAVGEPNVDLCTRLGMCHIGVQYAAMNPERVRRMALIQPGQAGSSPRNNPRYAPIAHLAEQDWDRFAELFALLSRGWEDTNLARAFYHRIRTRCDAMSWNALMDVAESLDASKDAPLVKCPTLVHYTGSPPQAIRSLAARIPAGRLTVQPQGPTPARWVPNVAVRFLNDADPNLDEPGDRGPSAFRTILFTDVVSSTPLLTQLKDTKMREVMRHHDEIMTTAVTSHAGRVVKTIGDAFMAEFAVPSAAVEAAIDAQRAIRQRFADADVPLRLRIGINAGEPIEEGGDLHGASVVIAKRLESAAGTDGILVSDVVKQMVTGKDFDFEDRGPLDLKGFDEPVRAWAVRWD